MRRAVFGLLSLAAVFLVLSSVSCQHEDSLRIVSVNGGKAIYSDLTDWGVYRDPEEGEIIPYFTVPEDVVPIELQYVEIGPGLPTWTPYQAHITESEIKYKFIRGEEPSTPLPNTKGAASITVVSDPTGEKTSTGDILLVSALVKDECFDSGAGPDDIYAVATFVATITLKGYDDASGLDIEAETDVQVNFGEYYDDPSRVGQ